MATSTASKRTPRDGGSRRGLEPGAQVSIIHGKPWKRTITMSGVVEQWRGDLLVIRRQFRPGGCYDSLAEPKLEGDYGTVEVAEGGWLLRRVYHRASSDVVGELYNVQTPAELRPAVVRYTDLEVDVVRWPDGRVAVVDEEDLAAAVRRGGISHELANRAGAIAHDLAAILRSGGDWRDADPGKKAARSASEQYLPRRRPDVRLPAERPV